MTSIAPREPAPEQRPLLLVDDDEAFGGELAGQLTAGGGYAVTRAATVAEAEARLGAPAARFDAVLLDVGLPAGASAGKVAKSQGSRSMLD